MGEIVELYPDGQLYDGLVCSQCGSEWWNAEILLDTTGRVTGWGKVADCRNCTNTATITGDVHNDR